MAELTELFWRPLPSVRMQERPRFLFFAGIATLISFGQTLGIAGSEALFMSEIGTRYLPHTIIASALLTVLGSIAYATRVGEVRNDRLFVQMLAGAGVVLAAATVLLVLQLGVRGVSVFLMCFYLVTQAVFLNHLVTFATDYFDIVASKRLLPLFMIGGSTGSFLGGLLTFVASELVGPQAAIGAWALLLIAAAVVIWLGRKRVRSWGPIDFEEADESSVEGIQGALRYVRASTLGRVLMVSALGMTLALVVARYMWLDAFATEFPDPAKLASFIGLYLAATNLIEIAVGMSITPWLIRSFGVPSTNLVHPLLTLVSFGCLAYQANIFTGAAARMNGEMLENSLANPVRNLLCNAIPMRFRGRLRAFLEGIVVYAGMFVGGLLLLILGHPDPRSLALAGVAATGLYLVSNLLVRREYLRTLVGELKAGRLDLTDLSDQIGGFEASRLAELWEQLLNEGGERPSQSMLKLIPNLAQQGVIDPLRRATGHPSWEVRRAILTTLAATDTAGVADDLVHALDDPEARVRLAALRGLQRRRGVTLSADRIASLMSDPDPGIRAEAALSAGDAGLATLEKMMASSDPAESLAALNNAPPALLDAAHARVADADPAVRAAAMECLARLPREPVIDLEAAAEALGDPDARVRRAAVLLLANHGTAEAVARLADAVDDPASEVQFTAESVLGSLAMEGVRAVRDHLSSESERAVESALRVVARSGVPNTRELLYRELRSRVRELWFWVIAYQRISAGESLAGRFLRAALSDGVARNRRLAFKILEHLESADVMRNVEKALQFGSPRVRGDALEVLSNLGDRESVRLLVTLHESGPLLERINEVSKLVEVPMEPSALIASSRTSRARWIRLGAEAFASEERASPAEEIIMERLLALQQISLFSALSLEQLEAVHQITSEVQYLEGEVIMREGERGDNLVLLLEGRVRVYLHYGELNETRLNELSAVCYLGEMAILDGGRRSATIVAAEHCYCLSLDGESLRDLLSQMPEISFEIFRVLAARVRLAEERLG